MKGFWTSSYQVTFASPVVPAGPATWSTDHHKDAFEVGREMGQFHVSRDLLPPSSQSRGEGKAGHTERPETAAHPTTPGTKRATDSATTPGRRHHHTPTAHGARSRTATTAPGR